MAIYLRQSTASQEIPLGYFVDSTDGNTEETGLTISNTDIKIWKTGATTLADKNSGGATHIANGIYYAVLDATDTDTIGPLVIFVHETGALTVRVECCVLDEAVYDVIFGTTALSTFATNGSVNVAQISGDSAAADNAEAFFDGTGYAGTNNVIPTVTTVNGLAANTVTATAIANDAITAAKIATGAIDADAIADNAIDAGAIAADAITAAKIADGAIDAATFAAGAITATVIATNAIDADSLAADAVAEIQTGLASAANLATVGEYVDTEIQTIITMLTGIVPVNGTIGATGNDTTHLHLSGLAYADDGPNSMLILVKDVSTGIFVSRWIEDFANTGDLATVATLPFTPEASADQYWIIPVRADVTTLSAAGVRTAVGLTSANLDTQLTAIDDYLDTEVAAIKAVTDAIGATGTGLSAIPWNAAWDAEVQSEVQDALDATVADSIPADGTRPSIAAGILMITRFLWEKAVSGTTVTVKKEDGSTSSFTATLDSSSDPTSITRAS
jgi:hypothetical protein